LCGVGTGVRVCGVVCAGCRVVVVASVRHHAREPQVNRSCQGNAVCGSACEEWRHECA